MACDLEFLFSQAIKVLREYKIKPRTERLEEISGPAFFSAVDEDAVSF